MLLAYPVVSQTGLLIKLCKLNVDVVNTYW